MKKFMYILMTALMAVATTSCVSQRNVDKNYAPFTPDKVRLNMTMDDYVYLGDVTIEVEYKTYLGIPKILTVNGEAYDPRFVRSANIAMSRRVKLGVLGKALYKVTDTYKDADYIVPGYQTEEILHMNMGRIKKRSMTFKVFRLAKSSVESQNAAMEGELNAALEAAEVLRLEKAELQKELEAAQQRVADLEALQRATRGSGNNPRRR